MIPQDKLDEWQALADKASYGPWNFDRKLCVGPRIESDDQSHGMLDAIIDCQSIEDAAFVATARTAVPSLIAEVRRLRAIIRANALDKLFEMDGDIIDHDKPGVT